MNGLLLLNADDCDSHFGVVLRSFQLPLDIDRSESRAKYDNGVLMFTLLEKHAAGGYQ
jgi:HSP20 family protein